MCTVVNPMRLGVIAHFLDVALKCVQVEEQAGRLNVSLAHAGVGGDVVADLEMCELPARRVHWTSSRVRNSNMPVSDPSRIEDTEKSAYRYDACSDETARRVGRQCTVMSVK
jgi:hypothetical protein